MTSSKKEQNIASKRKSDHINLAFQSQTNHAQKDPRFFYEPILSGNSPLKSLPNFSLANKNMKFPLWVSSMTGGTEKAYTINQNLAKACKKYGLGMGLGSCRSILMDNKRFKDFDWRETLSEEVPFFANLGIAQVEQVIQNKNIPKVIDLVHRLKADGLIIHINPLQEWFQPEGDAIKRPPIETITEFYTEFPFPLMVKEVGQGMGPKSLKALLSLPLEAIEFAAFGGTNFSKLELNRATDNEKILHEGFAYVGHTAIEMTHFINEIIEVETSIKTKNIIISGGIKSFLDGYYLMEQLNMPSVYGQASSLLRYAEQSYEQLCDYIEHQMEGYLLAKTYLKVKK